MELCLTIVYVRLAEIVRQNIGLNTKNEKTRLCRQIHLIKRIPGQKYLLLWAQVHVLSTCHTSLSPLMPFRWSRWNVAVYHLAVRKLKTVIYTCELGRIKYALGSPHRLYTYPLSDTSPCRNGPTSGAWVPTSR